MEQKVLIKRILSINIISSASVFLVVLLSSEIIVSFYGSSFTGMKQVLTVLILSSVFQSIIVVFSDNLLAEGKNWLMFVLRSIRDLLTIGLLAFILVWVTSEHAALNYAYIQVLISMLYAIILALLYYFQHRKLN